MPELTVEDDDEPILLGDIQTLDRVAADAWPALETRVVDGWLVRHGRGLSRRVDSVAPFAVGPGVLDIEDRIAAVEDAYLHAGTPPRFQISPMTEPDELDELLAMRGYEIEAPVLLMTREADNDGERDYVCDVLLSEDADDTWWDFYTEGFGRDARAIVERSRERPVFASVLDDDGRLAASGLGVAGGDFLGIFAMYTRPDVRRRGYGRQIIETLADEAIAYDIRNLYLQVERKNQAAQSMYTRAGFRPTYAYHYRTQWTTP